MNRIPWVDVAKGIAIILMVLGHSSMPDVIQHLIFAFHMPLFFVLSGLTTNWSKSRFMTFCFRKFIGLGRPFVLYSIVCISIIACFHLTSMSWCRGWGDFALWFVPVLLVALIIARVIIMTSSWIKWTCILFLPIISGGLKYFGIILPWNLSTVPLASFFILIGHEAKDHINIFVNSKWLWIFITFILTLFISHSWHLDMSRNQCTPLVPIIIGAIAGTISISSLSLVIDCHIKWLSRVLQAIGRETFIILAFSQVIIMTINKYFDVNAILKYSMLIAILVIIKLAKDTAVHQYNSLTDTNNT